MWSRPAAWSALVHVPNSRITTARVGLSGAGRSHSWEVGAFPRFSASARSASRIRCFVHSFTGVGERPAASSPADQLPKRFMTREAVGRPSPLRDHSLTTGARPRRSASARSASRISSFDQVRRAIGPTSLAYRPDTHSADRQVCRRAFAASRRSIGPVYGPWRFTTDSWRSF